MEDALKKYLCNFCKCTNKNNCLKIVSRENNGILTYKCENFVSKEEKQMNKKDLERFINKYCRSCKENCYRGLCDNGSEIVCMDKNIHLKKVKEYIKKD